MQYSLVFYLLWLSLGRQLSPTLLLAHSPTAERGRGLEDRSVKTQGLQ